MNEYWNEKLKLLTPMFHNNEVNGGEDTESIILELQQIAKDQREACAEAIKNEVEPYTGIELAVKLLVCMNVARNAEISLQCKPGSEVKPCS